MAPRQQKPRHQTRYAYAYASCPLPGAAGSGARWRIGERERAQVDHEAREAAAVGQLEVQVARLVRKRRLRQHITQLLPLKGRHRRGRAQKPIGNLEEQWPRGVLAGGGSLGGLLARPACAANSL